MLLWHVGATVWLFRWIFRDPKVDLRFLVAGAVLPDVIDLFLGTVVFAQRLATGELWAHALITPTFYVIVVLATTRRGRRRRAWMALAVGWLLHILLDGMWLNQEVFLWPFFGWEMPASEPPFWAMAWERALNDPWRWVLEIVGLVYLWWFIRAGRLMEPERRRELIATGRMVVDET